jgi:hypothetical protein
MSDVFVISPSGVQPHCSSFYGQSCSTDGGRWCAHIDYNLRLLLSFSLLSCSLPRAACLHRYGVLSCCWFFFCLIVGFFWTDFPRIQMGFVLCLLAGMALLVFNVIGLYWIFGNQHDTNACFDINRPLCQFQQGLTILSSIFALYTLYSLAIHTRYLARTGGCGAACAWLALRRMTYQEAKLTVSVSLWFDFLFFYREINTDVSIRFYANLSVVIFFALFGCEQHEQHVRHKRFMRQVK